jgi:hypothetical protein
MVKAENGSIRRLERLPQNFPLGRANCSAGRPLLPLPSAHSSRHPGPTRVDTVAGYREGGNFGWLMADLGQSAIGEVAADSHQPVGRGAY